jgi:serine/threonine protein phosphatase PrpC
VPYVSAVPEVTVTRLDRRDHFLILGSDGLWDVFSNVQAVNIVSRVLAKGGTVQDAKHTCVSVCGFHAIFS